ncbi:MULTISPECIES: hypothetical protein [Saliphagus]|uniref:Uncharacterized protein n=1 Tax=Saliphagus infecundisoli TaxID=1849069 RepID=A0ABD5QI00_9EURY|nr:MULTISPECIES: hypothetical protein [Saliphagus]
MVYVTRGLLAVLLEFASDADPDGVTIALSATPAPDVDDALPPEATVFTDFYLPDAGRSVAAVFGVDLSTPPGQVGGRFVSHPRGELSVTQGDDLAEVVLVTVPPWDRESVRAFDRRGRRRELAVVDAAPPTEFLE